MPYYTDPDSKALFAAKRRPKKKVKPIEGQDVTIQASQPAQTEDTTAHIDAGDVPASSNASNSARATEEVEITNDAATNVVTTSSLQPTAQTVGSIAQASSSGGAPPQSPQDETSKSHSTVPTADGATCNSKTANRKDGTSESSVDEPAPHTVKTAAVPLPPKNWADLLKKKTVTSKAVPDGQVPTNGINETQASGALGPSQPSSKPLADVLREYNPSGGKVFFIEPRGLYNARVDCYMISVSHTWQSSTIEH